MKYIYLVSAILILSYNSNEEITELEQNEFEKMAQDWNNKYMQGSKNLEEILSGLD